VLAEARGQTVWWHAWGGSPEVNAFIGWVAAEMAACCGVRVEHVKVADIAETVGRLLAEKAAGREEGGAVDLMWINGENFAALKAAGLLFGPWAEALPNRRLVDVAGAGLDRDFTVPVEGYESPWGLSRLVFVHDAARAPEPPRTIPALLDWARANPGRFAYPAPPDFTGAAFLRQALVALAPDPGALARPPAEGEVAAQTAALWAYLDALRPLLWRGGAAWPASGPRLRQLLADAEIDLAVSYNPNEAAQGVASGALPPSVRAYALDGGTLGNAHFVAIPATAQARAGAMAVADFLLSPAAQARMADPAVWGSATVLALDRLAPAARAAFEAAARPPGAIDPAALGPALPEPHPAWTSALEAEWARRYGAGR
jgi:putative thiamine transport system substrate-binding protein